jgi:hypothetical protein
LWNFRLVKNDVEFRFAFHGYDPGRLVGGPMMFGFCRLRCTG